MAVSSEHSLEATPESAAVSHLSNSARSSPRSTSDNPARNLQPISQHSRLLQPTLSWQAKAAWIPEPASTSATFPAQSTAEEHSYVTASSARSQALAAGRRTKLIEPASSFKDRDAAMADAQETAGTACQYRNFSIKGHLIQGNFDLRTMQLGTKHCMLTTVVLLNMDNLM